MKFHIGSKWFIDSENGLLYYIRSLYTKLVFKTILRMLSVWEPFFFLFRLVSTVKQLHWPPNLRNVYYLWQTKQSPGKAPSQCSLHTREDEE